MRSQTPLQAAQAAAPFPWLLLAVAARAACRRAGARHLITRSFDAAMLRCLLQEPKKGVEYQRLYLLALFPDSLSLCELLGGRRRGRRRHSWAHRPLFGALHALSVSAPMQNDS